MRRTYPTDLTDRQWNHIQHLVERPIHSRGRPVTHSRREIINAVFYLIQSGCAWRLLPHDFPPWKTVYHHFREWQNLGVWEQINDELVQKCRTQIGKRPQPTGAIIDSQSVKTTEKGGLVEDLTGLRKSKVGKDIYSLIR